MSSVFRVNEISHLKRKCFFDGPVDVARYDMVRYPFLDNLRDKQWSFFWKPEEVELVRDQKDFKSLTPVEQHIFSSNLKRQILLDSVQGRAPTTAFLPICSLPELEAWIQTWSFFEVIHSNSYTHIIRNIYSNPSIIYDDMRNITEIADCATDISKYYDRIIQINIDSENPHEPYQWLLCQYDNPQYEHKRALWLCLNAVNALEGIRFYVSFACSWNFAEQKKMEGNAKIIKFIARDENLHLASTQHLIKTLKKEDPDFARIAVEEEEKVRQIFVEVIEQEKKWAEYLFKDGSMIGLNTNLLNLYVDFISAKRMNAVGIKPHFSAPRENPLPWTEKWISGAEVQMAPQEVAISSYTIGKINKDVTSESFTGFEL